MKIAHVVAYYNPERGYEEYHLPVNQAKLGHEVYLITSNKLEDDGKVKAGFFNIGGVKVYRLACLEYKGLVFCKGIKRLLKKINPDLVHVHEPRFLMPALATRYKNLGYKLIVDVHDPSFTKDSTFLSKYGYLIFRKPICNFSFKKADLIMANTQLTKDFLIENHGFNKNVIKILPLGSGDELKFDKVERDRLRKKLKINKKDIILITLGQISKLKRLEWLLQVFSNIKEGKLLIVGGDGEKYINELKRLSNKLRIDEKVIFVGDIPKKDVAKYYSASDIAIWPYKASMSIQDAMACKLPLILPNIASVNHLVQFNNGILFEAENLEEMKGAIKKLIKDNKLREKMGKNSYEAFINNFTYKKIAEYSIEVYRELLKS